jgi:hypothetical protein
MRHNTIDLTMTHDLDRRLLHMAGALSALPALPLDAACAPTLTDDLRAVGCIAVCTDGRPLPCTGGSVAQAFESQSQPVQTSPVGSQRSLPDGAVHSRNQTGC